ncbi:MAG: GGDEF domain-containing protein [Lachnospiraceae bacterium]|nr:GGDEF domain-containing protein [Lachnospiraceae bacterium]
MQGNMDFLERHPLVREAFRAMLENTKDLMFIKDANLVYVVASMPFVKMVGKVSAEEIIGRTDLEIFEDENLARRYIADDKKLIAQGENQIDYIEPLPEENGRARYGSTSKYILSDENGEFLGILGITKDITRDYLARQRYQQELKFLFELPKDTYAVSYIDVDSWRVISQRRREIDACTLQSCYTVEGLCEAAAESIVDKACVAAEFYRKFDAVHLKEIYTGGRNSLTFKYQRRLSDGSLHWVQNDVRFMMDVDSGHLCVMLSAKNIDMEKMEEQKLVVAAKMDKMTMVLNRETTMENIQVILRNEADKKHVLFMIDVDNFKSLNDTLGHLAGDAFLIKLAAEIRKTFRESDVVGRVGGDEFFALMRNIQDYPVAERKAEELLSAIWNICTEYPDISLSGSIGVSLYPENGKTLGELYAQADTALYQAKRSGKNQFVFAGNSTTPDETFS